MHKFHIRPDYFEFLAGLVAAAVFLAAVSLRPGSVAQIGRALRRTARRRALWITVCAFLGPCIRLAILPLAPIPSPTIHDEFVHLLAADTLLQGRLANPPHPFSDHFETIYVIQRPTYAAGYPLGTAAFLAAGWKVAGEPWFGVWMAMVLCCGSVAWMQYRWLPPLAAWTGGLLCSLALGISSWWMNSYYGSEVAAAGGALLLGALPALIRTARLRYAFILSAGWTLVWFVRPYESVMLGLVTAAMLLRWLWRNRADSMTRKAGTAALVVIVAAVSLDFAGFCYHNWRVTGDPLIHPYRLTQQRYGVPRGFVWQKALSQPPNLTPQQQRIYAYQWSDYRAERSFGGIGPLFGNTLKKVWAFYVGYPLTIPLLIGLLATFRKRRTRELPTRKLRTMWLILGVSLSWSLLYPSIQTNYLAPVSGLFFGISSYGLLSITRWRPQGRPVGIALTVGLCVASALSGFRLLSAPLLYESSGPLSGRTVTARFLESTPESHLVFVRYGPHHSVHDEWVYNRADIDNAKVIWANDLGADRNRKLIQYLAGRKVWLVEPDNGARLQPYP
jgi:hypothetical protein